MRIGICRNGVVTVMSVLIALLAMGCDSGKERPERDSTGEGKPKEATSEDSLLLAEGKEYWRSCGTCHCATDPRIKEDEDWVRLNEGTT